MDAQSTPKNSPAAEPTVARAARNTFRAQREDRHASRPDRAAQRMRGRVVTLLALCLAGLFHSVWASEEGYSSAAVLLPDGGVVPAMDHERLMYFRGGDARELRNSRSLGTSGQSYSLLGWVRWEGLEGSQRVVWAKNDYANNIREWTVMFDRDGLLSAFVFEGGWLKVNASARVEKGTLHQIATVLTPTELYLWLDGAIVATVGLKTPRVVGTASVSFGGVADHGTTTQGFFGSMQEGRVFNRPLTHAEVQDDYVRMLEFSKNSPAAEEEFELWDSSLEVPAADELHSIEDVDLNLLRKHETNTSGGAAFIHGVALASHRGRLYASFAFNPIFENTPGEIAICMVSENGGKTWYQSHVIDRGSPGAKSAISHGVFLSCNDRLYAFMAGFRGDRKHVRTRLYVLEERINSWKFLGVVAKDGFWPMQEPQRMTNGNWIMSGISIGDGDLPAVAISRGDNIAEWEVVRIERRDKRAAWSESTVIVDGNHILNISRHGPSRRAYVAESLDYGRTWSKARPSNLPMADSKPYAGVLSTGERYLIGTTTADTVQNRSPLTIALSRPGENKFSRILQIRAAEHATRRPAHEQLLNPLGVESTKIQEIESNPRARLAYPYAIERYGLLYVAYSNSGSRDGFNPNSLEIAVIPLSSLQIPKTEFAAPKKSP